MIRITAQPYEAEFAFTISRDGAELLTTIDPVRAAERLLFLGIDNPEHLIEAARHWGAAEIREYANPDWRGG